MPIIIIKYIVWVWHSKRSLIYDTTMKIMKLKLFPNNKYVRICIHILWITRTLATQWNQMAWHVIGASWFVLTDLGNQGYTRQATIWTNDNVNANSTRKEQTSVKFDSKHKNFLSRNRNYKVVCKKAVVSSRKQRVLCLTKFDGLVQERHNSIANALELRLSSTKPSRWRNSWTFIW